MTPCSSELPFNTIEVPQIKGPSSLHTDEIDTLVARYNNGESTRHLATALGIDRKTVSRHLERRDIPRRAFRRSLTDNQCTEIAQPYISGLSLTQIGEQYGVHAKTVSNELQKLNVEIPTAREKLSVKAQACERHPAHSIRFGLSRNHS